MGAIGGIFQYATQTAYSLDPMLPVRMSRAMSVRGGAQRAAYINKKAALLQNTAAQEVSFCPPRPLTRTASGYSYTVVADGTPKVCELTAEETLFDAAEQALEAYIALGSDFTATLCGNFALAILDERRSELLLLQGAQSNRPLFYCNDSVRFAFASEIKGLLRCLGDGIRIGRDRLWAYLSAPCGSACSASLYEDIATLPKGTGGVCSALGFSRFSYLSPTVANISPTTDFPITPPLLAPKAEELSYYLRDILFAFDYPQFDPWMPGLINTVRQSKLSVGSRATAVCDVSLYLGIDYAAERADRLGALCGVSLVPIAPQEFSTKERQLKQLDRSLQELLSCSDLALLRHLFGTERLQSIRQERNLTKRIRMRGMLYQLLLWAEHYPIVFT